MTGTNIVITQIKVGLLVTNITYVIICAVEAAYHATRVALKADITSDLIQRFTFGAFKWRIGVATFTSYICRTGSTGSTLIVEPFFALALIISNFLSIAGFQNLLEFDIIYGRAKRVRGPCSND